MQVQPVLAQTPPANFAYVCGTQICIDGQVFTVHGATTYGHYDDPNIFTAARNANLNTLELVEFDDNYHQLSDTMSSGTWSRVDQFIADAGRNGFHVILHTAEFGQSLKASGQSEIDVSQWENYLNFVVNRTNSVTGVKYADDPTILMIALYGEIDPNPGVTSFYQQTLAYLKSIDPNHLHATGGFSYLDGPSGLDTQWRGIMSDPNDDICEFEINSTGDRNTTAPEVTSYCKGINKPWFLAAWSSCTTGAGGGNLDNFGSDAAMAAHAQDMYNIASGGSPAADKSIGADFWNFGGTGGCDISLSQTPNTYAVVVNTAPGAAPVIPPTPMPSPAPGTINGSMLMASQNNMCLDVTDGNFTDGNRMQIWTCENGNPNQLWTFNPNGTISTQNNKCLDVTNGNFSDGNPVQIWECNGGTNQQWNLGADGLLHAAQNNECLDVTNWNFVNGNRMQIWTCNGGAAQKWSVKMSVSAGNGASSR